MQPALVLEATAAPAALIADMPSRMSDTSGVLARAPQTTRILVVDDDEWIRDLLARVLIRYGYQVSAAPSAEEALDVLRQSPYDLLISDMILTGMNGLELTSRVAHTHPDLPIVLITAHGHAEMMRQALRQGASDFIPKPFNIETIPIVIERNLERRSLERQRVLEQDNKVMYKTIQALAAAIDAKEPYTAQHSRRVASLAVTIAEAMRLPLAEQRFLELAAHVHDVGKIGTPDHILNKPGNLDEDEWQAMRHHPVKGAEIVGRVEELSYVADVVRHHHEWLNGAGYPDGLRGESIPLLSRIIAVADAYEVMTSDRVYHSRLPSDEALRRLQAAAGVQFDAIVVQTFIRLSPETLPLE
jgi:putative two-component system response regulator